MKTSFFKWKPDYDGAASEYSKAGVAFKNAKAYEQAIHSYKKAAEAHKQNGSSYHSAKSLEAAALVHKEQDELEQAADLIEQACAMYIEHGTPDTASSAYDRAAKMMEQREPDRAVRLYTRACEVAEQEDRPLKSAEFIGKASRVLIRQKRIEEALPLLRKELDYYDAGENYGAINRLMMGVTLCHLHLGDYVAADREFQRALHEYKRLVDSEEGSSVQRLLDAYDEGDQDAADAVLKKPIFKFMENAFTILARDLDVPPVTSVKPTSILTSQKPSQGAATAGPNEEEDEFADGLL